MIISKACAWGPTRSIDSCCVPREYSCGNRKELQADCQRGGRCAHRSEQPVFRLATRSTDCFCSSVRLAGDLLYPAAGGLMSYGASPLDTYRQMGTMTGPILKGKHHQDIPVLQPKRFELVINSKAARLLHLSIPLQMWVIADEINRVLAFLLRCTSPELAQRARAIVRPRQKSRVVRTKTEAIGDSVRRSSRLRAASAPTCMITAARLKHAPTLGYLLD